jgi:hypothetical protein
MEKPTINLYIYIYIYIYARSSLTFFMKSEVASFFLIFLLIFFYNQIR